MICLIFDVMVMLILGIFIAAAVMLIELAFNVLTGAVNRILGWEEKKNNAKEAASN